VHVIQEEHQVHVKPHSPCRKKAAELPQFDPKLP
jgi:hypothetical protein